MLGLTKLCVKRRQKSRMKMSGGKMTGSAPRRGYLLASTAFITLLTAPAAWGQAAEPVVAAGQPEQVVVTGSLLSNPNFTAPTPVTGVSAAMIDARAVDSIGQSISELPFVQAGGGLANNVGGIIGQAESFTNLRGLGNNRTLVLLDGQPPTPENASNNFDTSLIPSSLIQRFEVVTTGASASYGSDAVAGVVNFILKDRLEGFTNNLEYGPSQGGAENQVVSSFGYGTSFADGKGHFIGGAEFTNQYNTVNMYSRAWG